MKQTCVVVMSIGVILCLASLSASAQSCAPAWSATTTYAAPGQAVSESGINYKNNWWTLGDEPTTHNGGPGSGQPWTSTGRCGGAQKDFSIVATPGSQSVTAGGTASYKVTVTPSNGFNSAVSLAASGLPSGATASFNPGSISGGSGSSTLSVSTSSSTTAGSFTLTLTGTGGGLSHTALVTLTVTGNAKPDFSLSATPGSQTVTVGGSTSYKASVAPGNGFNGTVSLTVGGQPSGATATFSSSSISGGSGSSTLTVSTTSSTATGTFTIILTGKSGALSHSVTVTLTVNRQPPPPGNLPKHLLTGYWQDFNNGAKCLRIADVPTSFAIIAVAFANATGTPGAVDFTVDPGLSSCLGGYTEAQFISDIATAHGRGQKVIISVGGANGAISVSDAASAANFVNSVHSLMTKFGFDGVDIDLENGVDPTNMSNALHQLASMSPGMIITMAPQTLDMQSKGMAYFQLALNIQSILTIVNTQYYNSGTMLGCDSGVYAEGTENFETALACIQLQGGLRPDQVGLGLPAQAMAAGGGVVDPSVVVHSLNCLARGTNCGTFTPPTTWPTIRGAMTWSINWDASNGFNFSNTVKAALDSLP